MADQDETASRHQDGDAERLSHWVTLFQNALGELRRIQEAEGGEAARNEQRTALDQALKQSMSKALEQLYLALEPDLRKLAGGWIRSQQFQQIIAMTNDFAQAVGRLAYSAFGAIIEALPTLKIDPTLNPRKLLITVARRDLYDQEHKIFSPGPRAQAAPDQPAASGDLDGAMWHSATDAPSGELTTASDLKDGASTDFEERIISRDWLHRVWSVVTEFWHLNLPPDDVWLIRMRWFHDPPVPFKDIAQRLGAGWNEAAVKQRHHRILKRTYMYLKDQALVDANDEGR